MNESTLEQPRLIPDGRMEVFLVPPENVSRAWPYLWSLLAPSLEYGYGEYTEDDLRRLCMEGRMYLWAVIDVDNRVFHAAALSEVAIFPSCVQYWIVGIGGDNIMQWYEKMEEAFVAHAKRCGATVIRGNGRPGWARFLKRLGYEHTYVSMGKRIV